MSTDKVSHEPIRLRRKYRAAASLAAVRPRETARRETKFAIRAMLGSLSAHMSNIALRDFFAAHAPMAPNWFTSKIAKAKEEMVPDLARGPGYVKSNTVVIEETALQREVRWRFVYADAMVTGSTPAA